MLRSSQHPLIWVLGHNRVEYPVCQIRARPSLPPFSEDLLIVKAENNDKAENNNDSLQQVLGQILILIPSPVSLHGPSDSVLKGVLVSPTDLPRDNF